MSFVDCNKLVNFNNFDFITTGKVKKPTRYKYH